MSISENAAKKAEGFTAEEQAAMEEKIAALIKKAAN